MNKPLISICIPTYNRASFLKECLDSITKQFSISEVRESVDVFILDNQSSDDTEGVARIFTSIFENVKYVKDDKNRDIVRGIIKAASLADGEYIWVFSDDDLQTNDSLVTVINFIRNNQPKLLICNLCAFSTENIIGKRNLLSVEVDKIIDNRKEFFRFLDEKFYLAIDYYTTLCSDWIIKKEIFDSNYYIFEKFNNRLDLFPLPSLFFYTNIEFCSGIISKEIILNRSDNESWGSKNKIKRFIYRDSIWRDYYKKIIKNNEEILPRDFLYKVRIKNLLRVKELVQIIIIQFLRKIKIYDKLKKIVKKHN